MIHLIGLDPGFASIGYAVLRLDHDPIRNSRPQCVAFGVLVTEASAKKHKVLSVEDNVRRTIEIARTLRGLLASAPGTLALCAEAMSFPRSASVAAKMAMCWGVIASLSDATNTPILQATPVHIKRETTGSKTATKEEVQAAMLRACRCGACCRASLFACCQPQAEKNEECPRHLRETLKRTRATGEETPQTRGTESQNETPNGSGGKKRKP